MPTDATAQLMATQRMDTASRRILRLALGASLCMLFSQVGNWPLSFLAPAVTILLLGTPYPAPSFKGGLNIYLSLVGAVLVGHLLLPFLDNAPEAGLLLLALALFGSFYYTAMGGSSYFGVFLPIGFGFLLSIGSVSIDIYIGLTETVAVSTAVAFAFVWIAHALLPDPPPESSADDHHPSAPKPSQREAIRSALRAFVVVFPVAFLFLCISTSANYIPVMINVVTLGQQSSAVKSHHVGLKLVESTFWGGVGAILAWIILGACPNLAMYTLLTALAGLLYGPGIFKGEGLNAKGGMWSFAFMTMIIILAPALGSEAFGASAAERFWTRQLQFIGVALYGTFAVAAFNALWPGKQERSDA